jgi:hypothetical protein
MIKRIMDWVYKDKANEVRYEFNILKPDFPYMNVLNDSKLNKHMSQDNTKPANQDVDEDKISLMKAFATILEYESDARTLTTTLDLYEVQ